MLAKNTRLDIRTTGPAKEMLEQAASFLGTTLSAFMLEAAMSKAKDVVAQFQAITLSRKEAERFVVTLQNPPKANEKLKQLFKKHAKKAHTE